MNNEKTIPYSRFKEVNDKLKEAQMELQNLKSEKYPIDMTPEQIGYLDTMVYNELLEVGDKDINESVKVIIVEQVLNPLLAQFKDATDKMWDEEKNIKLSETHDKSEEQNEYRGMSYKKLYNDLEISMQQIQVKFQEKIKECDNLKNVKLNMKEIIDNYEEFVKMYGEHYPLNRIKEELSR